MRGSTDSTRPQAWHGFSRLLHWAMALVVLGMLGLGTYIDTFVQDVYEAFDLIQLHKSWGFVAFALGMVRIAWRCLTPAPALPDGMPGWQRMASRVSHLLLYALLIVMPVSGWLYASASEVQDLFGIPNEVFGLFALPDPFQPGSRELADVFGSIHGIASRLLILVVAVHVAAALKHHFIDRDKVLMRMIRSDP